MKDPVNHGKFQSTVRTLLKENVPNNAVHGERRPSVLFSVWWLHSSKSTQRRLSNSCVVIATKRVHPYVRS